MSTQLLEKPPQPNSPPNNLTMAQVYELTYQELFDKLETYKQDEIIEYETTNNPKLERFYTEFIKNVIEVAESRE